MVEVVLSVVVLVLVSAARVSNAAPGTKTVASGLNLKVVVMMTWERVWYDIWDMSVTV